MSARETRIEEILARLDEDAANGYSSNWAEIEELRTTLIVTMADGGKRRFTIPAAS
jgi:hypothetical protein